MRMLKEGRSAAAAEGDAAKVRATVETVLRVIAARGDAAVRELSTHGVLFLGLRTNVSVGTR
jgi:hypothetical protein